MLFNGVQSFIPGAEGDVTWCSLYNPLCMREDFIKEHPQEAQAVVRAMIKSNDFINNNLKEAAEIVADKLQLEPEQTEMIMSKNIYGVFFDNDLKKAVQNLNEFYLSQGQIPYVPEFEDYADPSVVLAVDPSIVSEELK
jgi:NitT/TauT family transport system substrate-binding protein